ncbi:MAG: hypothetical protein WC823_03700 [Parcubacteria group bacterium]|jgi:hypothetical protein
MKEGYPNLETGKSEAPVTPSVEEKTHRYPERASFGIGEKVAKLKKLESGELGKLELSETERKELLHFENTLGEKIENIFLTKTKSTFFYLEYLTTADGKKEFLDTVGVAVEGETLTEIEAFLFAHRNDLKNVAAKKRTALSGKSRTFSDGRMLEKIESNLDADGNLGSLEQIQFSKKINLVLDPGISLEKVKGYRDLKKEIKEQEEQLLVESGNLAEAKRKILKLYRERINISLASLFGDAVVIDQMKEAIGDEALSAEEQELLNLFPGLSSADKNYSRLDLLQHGGSRQENAAWATQITPEISSYANGLEKKYVENMLQEEAKMKEIGLDQKKVMLDKSISADEYREMVNELLDHYNLRSDLAEDIYDSDRIGPAPDNKWQFIARAETKSMSVNGGQKVIKSGDQAKSAYDAVAVLLAHEIEGHVLQAENRAGLQLRIMEKVGLGRSGIISEGGAMYNQDLISRRAFNTQSLPHVHYVRAMLKKIEGGNFLDCVKEFYQSAIKAEKIKKDLGFMDEAGYENKVKSHLKLALDRVGRLFNRGSSFDAGDGRLADSSNTAYLEQKILLDELEKSDAIKYAFVGGVGLDALVALAELGLIELDKIKEPEYYSLHIWEKIKDRYALDEVA